MLESIFRHLYIIAGLLILGLIAYKLFEPKHNANELRSKTDTVIVKEIHHYHSEPNIQPIKITIQQKVDTSYRKEAEKKTIITGVQMNGRKLDIQKVDTNGVVSEEKFTLDEGSKVTITPEGVEQKKRTKAGKFLQKAGKVVKNGLAIVGMVAIAALTVIVATK